METISAKIRYGASLITAVEMLLNIINVMKDVFFKATFLQVCGPSNEKSLIFIDSKVFVDARPKIYKKDNYTRDAHWSPKLINLCLHGSHVGQVILNE